MTEAVNLKDRDFVLVIDSSGSMATADQKGGKTRWEAAAESTIALASKASKYDPDGLTLYTFAGKHRKFDNIESSAKVSQVFEEVEPNGSTNLDGVLKDVFTGYLYDKQNGKAKPNGQITVVITDGQPDDPAAVKRTIIDFTQKLDKDEEFGLLFVQVGNDGGAKAFLKSLDDDLKGAKFDIVDAITLDEVGDRTLTEVLAGAISD
jgi:Mg-chelatase subunit ChlD